MAYFRCGGGGIDNTLRLTKSQYEAIVDKDSKTLYLIVNANGDQIREIYKGSDRFDVSDSNNFEFKYKNIYIPGGCTLQGGAYNEINNYNINTGIKPFSTDNNSRSFEIIMKVHPAFSSSPTPDRYNIISVRGGSHYLTISVDSSYNLMLDEYNSSQYDTPFTAGDVIKIIYNKLLSKRQIYINNSLINEYGMPNMVDDTSIMTIFGYAASGYIYYMPGLIDEMSFRFLS